MLEGITTSKETLASVLRVGSDNLLMSIPLLAKKSLQQRNTTRLFF